MFPERIIGGVKPREAMRIFMDFNYLFVCLWIFVVACVGGLFICLVRVWGALWAGFLSKQEWYRFRSAAYMFRKPGLLIVSLTLINISCAKGEGFWK